MMKCPSKDMGSQDLNYLKIKIEVLKGRIKRNKNDLSGKLLAFFLP